MMKFKFNLTKANQKIKQSSDNSMPSLGHVAVKSIKTMRTNMLKMGFEKFISTYLPYPPNIDSEEDLRRKIYVEIEKYKKEKNLKTLENIFHLIQLWGGNAGRLVYIRNEGFSNNINIKAYKELAECSMHAKNLNELVDEIAKFKSQSKYIGVAFLTKHTRFFSRFNKNFKFMPIYDSEMSRGYLKKFNRKQNKYLQVKNPTRIDTPTGKAELLFYWESMIRLGEEHDKNLEEVERILFVSTRGK